MRQKEPTFFTGRKAEEEEEEVPPPPEVGVDGVSKEEESRTQRELSLRTSRRSMAEAQRKSAIDFFWGKYLSASCWEGQREAGGRRFIQEEIIPQ